MHTHTSHSINDPNNTYVKRGKCSFSLPVDEKQEKEE